MISYDFKTANKTLDEIIKRAQGVVKDLRPAFRSIASDFQKGNRAIFKLKSRGQYPDFSGPKVSETWKTPGRPEARTRKGDLTAYQNYKVAQGITPKGYPLLKLTGKLERSLTSPGGDAIMKIGLQSLELGTKVPYAKWHQFGTKNIPRRPAVFLEPGDGAPDGIARRRLERWQNILNDFIIKSLKSKKV